MQWGEDLDVLGAMISAQKRKAGALVRDWRAKAKESGKSGLSNHCRDPDFVFMHDLLCCEMRRVSPVNCVFVELLECKGPVVLQYLEAISPA